MMNALVEKIYGDLREQVKEGGLLRVLVYERGEDRYEFWVWVNTPVAEIALNMSVRGEGDEQTADEVC